MDRTHAREVTVEMLAILVVHSVFGEDLECRDVALLIIRRLVDIAVKVRNNESDFGIPRDITLFALLRHFSRVTILQWREVESDKRAVIHQFCRTNGLHSRSKYEFKKVRRKWCASCEDWVDTDTNDDDEMDTKKECERFPTGDMLILNLRSPIETPKYKHLFLEKNQSWRKWRRFKNVGT